MSGKKFLSPVLYPRDRSLQKKWFIKYQVEDWVNGGFKYEKYVGLLNRLNTVEERHELAMQYINKMHQGGTLDNYQGLHSMPASGKTPKQETNVVACCLRHLQTVWVEVVTGELTKATYVQNKTKVNAFIKWLELSGNDRRAIGGIGDDDCTAFMQYLLLEKKLTNTTYNEYKSLLARIWDKYKKQIKGYNPWREIKSRKKNTKHLESYSMDLQIRIQDTLPDYNPQLWIFFQCIYYCAIRPRSELRFIQVKHVDLDNAVITVPADISKNHKARHIVIYNKLVDQLRRLELHKYAAEDYLFTINKCPGPKPVSKNYFGYKWNDYRKEFKVPDCYKMYGAKHTAGKRLSKQNSPYITKEHFDHQSLATTQSYIDGLPKSELQFLNTDYPEFAKP